MIQEIVTKLKNMMPWNTKYGIFLQLKETSVRIIMLTILNALLMLKQITDIERCLLPEERIIAGNNMIITTTARDKRI